MVSLRALLGGSFSFYMSHLVEVKGHFLEIGSGAGAARRRVRGGGADVAARRGGRDRRLDDRRVKGARDGNYGCGRGGRRQAVPHAPGKARLPRVDRHGHGVLGVARRRSAAARRGVSRHRDGVA